jgi:hypothetical protein
VTVPEHWPDELHEGEHVAPEGQVTEQSTQAVPGAPHTATAVPGWHIVPSQHAPLQASPPEQLVLHVDPLQAFPVGQSVARAQPHTPATHALPFALPAQSTQADEDPQAVATLGMHVPIEPPQQNPFPQPPPSHSEVQEPATHVGVAPAQATQVLPPEPHCALESPGTQSVPSQHPPLHVSPPAQLVEHSPVPGWHASSFGQLFVVQEG